MTSNLVFSSSQMWHRSDFTSFHNVPWFMNISMSTILSSFPRGLFLRIFFKFLVLVILSVLFFPQIKSIFFFLLLRSLLCSPRLHSFNYNFSKNINIVKFILVMANLKFQAAITPVSSVFTFVKL